MRWTLNVHLKRKSTKCQRDMDEIKAYYADNTNVKRRKECVYVILYTKGKGAE